MLLGKRIAWIVLILVAVAGAGSTTTSGSQRSTLEIMHRKLAASQQLLGALVLAEFDDIRQIGDELDSLAEFQSWFVLPTPEYAQYTREFREAAQSIAAAGARKDVAGAFDSYTSLVGTCLQCHDYMR